MGRHDDDVLEAGRGGEENQLAASAVRRLPRSSRNTVEAGSLEHHDAVTTQPLCSGSLDGNQTGPAEAFSPGSVEDRIADATPCAIMEAGVMGRVALEGAGGNFPGGMPL